jgi:hypothetical protein
MLISVNKDVENVDFEKLITLATNTLQETSTKQNDRYLTLLGNKLEDEVYDVMCSCAQNTPFEGTIELVSGQKFPDIIANNYYGVEVKSTKQNHWKTTGNSVLESTRVEDIQRIYMLFGKIHNPIEFKCRLYQDCLYDVLVTHSPRYAIDMDLNIGETIFDKLGVEYDIIRQSQNPIKPFKDYYRSKLSKGQELWWLENEEYKPDSIIFKLWKSLSKEERDSVRILGYVYFPEVIRRQSPNKYDNFALWLSVKQRIICTSVRDVFSAGGKENIEIAPNVILKSVPKSILKLLKQVDLIVNKFASISIDTFNETWKTDYSTKKEICEVWINNVVESASTDYDFKTFNFKKWLSDKLSTATNNI